MTYNIDPSHSNISFKVRHMEIAYIRGSFHGVGGTIDYDPANPTASKIDASWDVSTVNTREEKRDGHLVAPDFFDAANFPKITFKSKQITANGAGFKVTGDLTIHGVTKEVAVESNKPTDEAKDPWGNMRRGIEGTGSLSRKEYGLVWNVPMDNGFMLGDKVDFTLDLEMTRKAE
jgi:polyisoprenoid-binding protein YceI